MKDTDLYSRTLGLSAPWFVADVALVAYRMLPQLWAAMCAFASLLLVSTVGYSRI